MPDESSGAAVSEKHLEAWRMNRENAQRSDPQSLENVAEAALLDSKLRLIQDVPIGRHHKNQARYTDKSVLMECMLQDFWEQLGDAWMFFIAAAVRPWKRRNSKKLYSVWKGY